MLVRVESRNINKLTKLLKHELNELYGPIIGGKDLLRVLGYPTNDAFRQALHRKSVPVPVFSIQKRNGKFALSSEVAQWLAEQRVKNEVHKMN